jgi:hypothetical protein
MINSRKNTKLMPKAGIVLVFMLMASVLQAQENKDITFDEASMKFAAQVSANGIGLFFRNTKPGLHSMGKVFEIGFSSIKHYKEKTILNQRIVNTSPYIFGKINKFYAIRPMFGYQKTLAEKRSKNSVGVNAFAAIGPAIGLLKPVYVNVEAIDPNNPNVYISMPVRYEPEKISPHKVIGNSSFVKGIDQTKIVAGVSLKTGVEFNWGYYSSEYKSIEVGVLVDYFPSRPQILYNIKNKTIYSAFYLSFAFGKNY